MRNSRLILIASAACARRTLGQAIKPAAAPAPDFSTVRRVGWNLLAIMAWAPMEAPLGPDYPRWRSAATALDGLRALAVHYPCQECPYQERTPGPRRRWL